MSDGCCCGATKSNPCVCMKKGITKCSKSEPKCPCYAEKDKKSFEKAWSVVKEDSRPPTPLEAMQSRYLHFPNEVMNCRKLAAEHGGEPCVLCGGNGDWCWNAGLNVNEDGSLDYSMMQGYDEKGRPLKKSNSLVKMPRTLEDLKLYESGKCPSCEGTGQQMVTVGSGDTSQSQSIDEAREMAMRDVEYSMMECVACGGTGVPDDEIWGDEGIMEYEDYE
jgi:hypothetical protein